MSRYLVGATIDLDVEGILTLSVQPRDVHVIYSESGRQRAAHFTPAQLLETLLHSPDVTWETTREGGRS